MDATFLQERIDATKAQIVAYDEAIAAIVSGNVQQYTIDTGQSRQVVTRLDLTSLQRTVDSLMNRLATYEARLNGGSVVARPAW